ncbi:MAG: CHAT domain-containing protein, partial [Anaerolineae bacterium]
MSTLQLALTDFIDPTRWRWVLSDGQGRFLADHDVHLDPTGREYGGFVDVSRYLKYHEPIKTQEAQLEDLGAWIGEQVFGDLQAALRANCTSPAVAVQVTLPRRAEELLLRPFELARFADGTGFLEAGVRFVYHVEGGPAPGREKTAGEKLRVLAAFSLPVRANPLNLRRERYGLQRLVRELAQTRGLALELRVLQYGATCETLRDALEEGEGWDVIHLSGHGNRGELLLEDAQGGTDKVGAGELGDLLAPARGRLKLLILDACYSGAGSHRAARAQLGLEQGPTRQEGAEGEAVEAAATTALPNLAQALSQRLDTAALAMRYPVGDAFATDLMLALYEKLLARRQALPGALHLALGEALEGDVPRPPLSAATPILVGPRAAELRLETPRRPVGIPSLPQMGLGIAFPPEPARFVGRLQPMLRASQALAPRSDRRGVLFYGMPGAGKTSCALELAYRHAEGRFQGYVWYRAPEAGSDVAGELFNVLFEIERQLGAPDLGLTTALDKPDRFRQFTLPRLRALLGQNSLLLVLDNLETLLTGSGNWRDPLWGDVVAALLGHDGPSRAVFTSRRLPAGLADHPGLQVEPMHALSLAESVLLARELPHLRRLFDDEAGQELLYQTLRVVQGHPKLLELADGLAGDR